VSSVRFMTINLEWSRGLAGCFAIKFRGSGYLKSESFIAHIPSIIIR